MNAAQIHLALNHVPLFLSIIGGGILILGLIRKNDAFKSLSLYLLVAAAIFTIPVFQTGEGTEEMVEEAAGVAESAIGKHEDMAKISMIIILITGALALAGLLFRKREGLTKLVLPLVLLFSLASFGTMAQTAHLGGLIRHTELQSGQAAANGEGKESGEKEKEEDEHKKEQLTPAVNPADSTGTVEKKKDKDDDD